MVGPRTRYVWHLEGIFQEDVEQITYPVYQKNQRVCEEYKKQYASNPFDNGTIETGNTLITPAVTSSDFNLSTEQEDTIGTCLIAK